LVYEDDERKKPYIVEECKKDGISQAETRDVKGVANLRVYYSDYENI
jgi:hypothetical protein